MPHQWADRFIKGFPPSITARYFSAGPSDSVSRRTPCPPKYCKRWLQVRLGCIRLSPSCPFRRLHTFRFLRPARNYPRFWIWRPSSERQRDLNPPEQHAAPHAIRFLFANNHQAYSRATPTCLTKQPAGTTGKESAISSWYAICALLCLGGYSRLPSFIAALPLGSPGRLVGVSR